MKIKLISDFNLDPLKRTLESNILLKGSKISCSPYGQFFQTIIQIEDQYDLIFIWFNPENIFSSFNNAIYRKTYSSEFLRKEINELIGLLKILSKKTSTLLIANLFNLPNYKTFGILDYKGNLGPLRVLLEINQKLAEAFDEIDNTYLIDSSNWFLNTTPVINNKLYYSIKMPFFIRDN